MKFNFEISKKLLPIKAHYFLYSAGLAPILPFLPVIAKSLGCSAMSVGLIYTVTPLTAVFVKPTIAALTDRFGIDKIVFLFVILLSGLTLFSTQFVPPLPWALVPVSAGINCTTLLQDSNIPDSQVFGYPQFWLLLVLIVVTRVSNGSCNSIADSITFNLLGDKPQNYGAQKMWSGTGFGLLTLISTLLVDALGRGQDLTSSYCLLVGLIGLDLVVVWGLKITPRKATKNVIGEVGSVLKDPRICVFLAWCFLNGVFLSALSSFLFLYVEDLDELQGNANSAWIKTIEGLATFVQTLGGEVPFFFFSGWILNKIGHNLAMSTVLAVLSLRFFFYSILTQPWLVLPIESLQGPTYGIFYATMTTFSQSVAPPGTECTVQSLSSVMYEGAGVSVGSMLTGYLINSVGYKKTFSILSTSALIFAVLHFSLSHASLLRKTCPKEKIITDDSQQKEVTNKF